MGVCGGLGFFEGVSWFDFFDRKRIEVNLYL